MYKYLCICVLYILVYIYKYIYIFHLRQGEIEKCTLVFLLNIEKKKREKEINVEHSYIAYTSFRSK